MAAFGSAVLPGEALEVGVAGMKTEVTQLSRLVGEVGTGKWCWGHGSGGPAAGDTRATPVAGGGSPVGGACAGPAVLSHATFLTWEPCFP